MSKSNYKTKIDFTLPVTLFVIGALLLSLFLLFPKLLGTTVGLFWILFCSLIMAGGLWKFVIYEVSETQIVKRDFLLIRKRKLSYKEISNYKIKQSNLGDYPEYNLFGLLKLFGIGPRYSRFRILTIGLVASK
jgi:hypothetical protein